MASVVAFLVLSATAAFADERADFEKGRNAFLAKDYLEADARFAAMLDPTNGSLHSKEAITQAQMYWGAVKLSLGKKGDASALFEKVILANPQYDPDPLSFPTAVLDAFTDTRAKLRDKLNQIAEEKARNDALERAREAALAKRQGAYVVLLEQAASEEHIIIQNSRWVAMLPFGVGQFQNDKPVAGYVFLSVEAALVIGTGVTFGIYRYNIGNATDALLADASTTQADKIHLAKAYLDRASTVREVNLGLVAGLAVAAAIGIVEAQVNYVPTLVATRKRPLPRLPDAPPANDPSRPASKADAPKAWLVPTLAPVASIGENGRIFFGAQVGVVGAF